jgi:hypothetical protein
MNQADPMARDLARWLLAQEAKEVPAPAAKVDAILCAVEKLRVLLTKRIGGAGFHALLARALALAKTEVRWLRGVNVTPEGALEGFEETAQQYSADEAMQARVALLAQLIGLLITFIGRDLTLRLLRDAWPEAVLNDTNFGTEERP